MLRNVLQHGVDFELVQGIMAGGRDAMFKAKEGAEDSKELTVEDLKAINLTKNDMVIGLAASGKDTLCYWWT